MATNDIGMEPPTSSSPAGHGDAYLLDGPTRYLFDSAEMRDRVVQIEWFREPGSSVVLLALRRLSIWTLADLARLRVADFRAAYGHSPEGLVILRRCIQQANIGLSTVVPRPATRVQVRAVPRPPPSLRQVLTARDAASMSAVADILPLISARDIRFGARHWPHVPLAQFLDSTPAQSGQRQLAESRIDHLHAVHSRRQHLLDELSELLPNVGRNVEIAKSRWAWDGRGSKTLEQVGQEYGLTRERVRQLVAKVAKGAGFAYSSKGRRYPARPAYLPTAQAIVALAEEVGGAGYQRSIAALAVERGLLRNVDEIAALEWLPELGLLPPASLIRTRETSGHVVVAVSKTELGEFRTIARIARRELGRRSVVSVSELVGTLAAEGVSATVTEVESALLRDGDVEPLAGGTHFWSPDDAHSKLLETIGKPLVTLGPRSAPVLQRALRRASSRRPEYGTRVPTDVLEEALARSPYLVAEGNLYRWDNPHLPVVLHALEDAFLEIIDDVGPVVAFNSFRTRLAPAGWNPVTMSLYLGVSPLLDNPSRGMYHLLGADVVPSDFEHARRVTPRKRARRNVG